MDFSTWTLDTVRLNHWAVIRDDSLTKLVERLEVGTVHMCSNSVSGYRPLITPPPSLGNLLLDITMFNFIPVSFSSLLFLGLGFGFGIGNLKHISQVALPAQGTVPSASVLSKLVHYTVSGSGFDVVPQVGCHSMNTVITLATCIGLGYMKRNYTIVRVLKTLLWVDLAEPFAVSQRRKSAARELIHVVLCRRLLLGVNIAEWLSHHTWPTHTARTATGNESV